MTTKYVQTEKIFVSKCSNCIIHEQKYTPMNAGTRNLDYAECLTQLFLLIIQETCSSKWLKKLLFVDCTNLLNYDPMTRRKKTVPIQFKFVIIAEL